jgi:hypothetical protein
MTEAPSEDLGNRLPREHSPLQLEDDESTILIDAKEIQRAAIRRDLSPDQRQAIGEQAGRANEEFFELCLGLSAVP